MVWSSVNHGTHDGDRRWVNHEIPRAAPPQPKSQARRREGCEDIAKKTFADLGLLCVFALWLARTDAFRKLVPRTSHYRGEPRSKNTLLNYSNTEAGFHRRDRNAEVDALSSKAHAPEVRTIALTLFALVAFAANSVLCRL